MQIRRSMLFATTLAVGTLMVAPQPSQAQYDQYRDRHQQFYNGAYNGGRGGNYNRGNDYGYGRPGYGRPGYDDRYRGHGIGTGTGALIGGGGGAALGALFGGGLKGALIGGAAGAGIGALAGHAHQESQKRRYYNGRYR